MNNQHLLVKFPIPFDHLGLTTVNHKWDLHVVLLRLCPVILFNLVYRYWEITLHEDKIFVLEPQLSEVSNQIDQ